MTDTHAQIHNYVDTLDGDALMRAFAALLNLAPEEEPEPGDLEAIAAADAELASGEYYTLDDLRDARRHKTAE